MSKPPTRIKNHTSKLAERQRELLDILPSATLVTRYDGTIIFANQRVKNEYGAEVGQNIQIFYQHVQDRENFLHTLQEKGYIDNFEMPARKADGTLVWILLSARQFDFDGERTILSSLVDITGRKQAEEALRTSEEKFRTIFMVSSDGIYISKPEGKGKLVDVNEAFAVMTGYTREEIIGQSALELGIFYDPADRERLLHEVEHYGICKEIELKIRKKNGEVIFGSLSGQLIYLDGEMVLMGVMRDISARKHAEDEIKMLKHSIDNHYDSAYWFGPDNRIVYINTAGCKSLGYRKEEVIGQSISLVDPLATPEAMVEFWERLRRDGYYYSMEIFHRRKDGSEFPVDSITTYVNYEGREYACGFTRDITERKRAEAELQRSRANLAALVESTDNLIWSVDINYRLITYNKALDQHFIQNYGTHAIIGALPEAFLPPDRATRWPDLYERAINEGPYRLEYGLPGGRTLELSFNPIIQQEKTVGVSVFGKDITERKKAEEATRISEARLRRAELASKSGNWELHLDTRTMIASEGAAKLYGLAQERFEYEYAKQIPLPEYRPLLDAALKNLIEKNEPYDVEFKIKTADTGEIKDIHSIARFDKERKILFGIIQDITERKRAEISLRESETRYRALFEQSPDGVVILNPENIRPIEFNDQVCRQLGYTREEFSKLSLADIEADETLEDTLYHVRNIMHQGRDDFEAHHRTKQGEIRNILVTAHLIYAGNTPLFHCLWRDITDRKKAEEALLESEERFHAMFQGHGAMMLLVEPTSGQILEANIAAQNFYGYPIHSLQQMRIDEINVLPPSEVAEQRKLALHKHLNYFVFPHRLANGQIRSVEVHSTPIKIGGKSILFSIIHDVTERVSAEENLARQAERMQILHLMERAITSKLELKHILDLLASEVVKQIHVDACSILLLNPQTNKLEFTARKGFHTKALKFTRLALGVGLAGRAAKERKIIQIANLSQVIETGPSLIKAVEGEKFVSYFGIPLIAKDQVLGVMEIFHRTELKPTPDWIKFLDTLADQAAISIDNARLLETTQQSLKEANALYRINKDLIAAADADFLMKNVVDLLQENFRYHYVQIFVADPKTGNFMLRAGSGEIGQKLQAEGFFLTPGEGIVGFTAETGKAFFTNDVDQVISSVKMPYLGETKSELAVPIRVGERMLGLLDVHQVPPATLTERDMQLVSVVADQLAVAHQKAQMYAELQNALKQEQTTRDALIQAEKLTLSGRLLASVSHELNNPIQAIQNALFLLKSEEGISSQGKQDLEIVLSETERMANLLERLRATYQPTNQKEFRFVQVNDLITDTCALVATHLRHSGISHTFLADPNLPSIPALANQLRQVFLNLVMNAVDAMPKGGRLTLSTQLLPDANEVLIKIADTGTGIDENIFPNIFEAFVTNKERGTGLGLAISYEIILKHDGRIKAENNPDQGATVSIWLPISAGGEG